MITQAQCAVLFIGLAVILGAAVYGSLRNDQSIQTADNPAGATKRLIIGVLFLAAVYFIAMWWNAQFQPGGYFLP